MALSLFEPLVPCVDSMFPGATNPGANSPDTPN